MPRAPPVALETAGPLPRRPIAASRGQKRRAGPPRRLGVVVSGEDDSVARGLRSPPRGALRNQTWESPRELQCPGGAQGPQEPVPFQTPPPKAPFLGNPPSTLSACCRASCRGSIEGWNPSGAREHGAGFSARLPGDPPRARAHRISYRNPIPTSTPSLTCRTGNTCLCWRALRLGLAPPSLASCAAGGGCSEFEVPSQLPWRRPAPREMGPEGRDDWRPDNGDWKGRNEINERLLNPWRVRDPGLGTL